MGVNSLPKTVTRQRSACDFWTQALLRMSPAWVRFLMCNTDLVQYRWTGLDLLTADRLKMQDWKIVISSKYSLCCRTYVFHPCIFVLAFSVAPCTQLNSDDKLDVRNQRSCMSFTACLYTDWTRCGHCLHSAQRVAAWPLTADTAETRCMLLRARRAWLTLEVC